MIKDSFNYTVQEYSNGSFKDKAIESILEIPLTINLNGREVVTLLTTAKFPDYLAIGFLKSDAYISTRDQITDLKITEFDDRIVADVSTSHDPWKGRVLEYSITSGCGKGTNFGRNVSTISKRLINSKLKVTPEQILEHAQELHRRSTLYGRTRGCHNSSLCTPEEMLYFREDIGRHNAIDMIVGQCFFENVPADGKMIVSTGRVASEILLKAVRIGVPVLASTAVATSFSVELARKIGITLIGNISDNGFWVYNDQGRISGL
ncbi:formate dehydrogenase accessory sulfurtransferase FdhD [Maridesulfovibrio hydrothermalis]|uniref:Sulfur carrier protein FdhD n=1 Tax=Maridesulfovibrio hydrothermalis AM13 = DSM 14728 TaxID=1121451 RepID=L0RF10_9BACT|nr:formate dehydrogenase accessory sulfurtransferase FdhD [Maridesulfovibrio hydrothermalis]CCO25368.1 Formate dehydrogenase family accessory protein FdhD [Maridesulfovibrio hydrothermalis AM13 = DSM 14728]